MENGERLVLSAKEESWTDKTSNEQRHAKVFYTTIKINGTDHEIKLKTVFQSDKYLLLNALGIQSK